ncbi:hypothetical protein J6590_087611 [Homalodisca vitripennis]|nr:hypothetical protein J6590_087611 [Homalodisca vitripennis]
MNNTELNHTSSLNSSDTIDRTKSNLNQNSTLGGSQTCSQKLNSILTNSKTADTQNSTPGESQTCSQEPNSILINFKTIRHPKVSPTSQANQQPKTEQFTD